MQRADRGFAPRRPSAAALVVLVLHLLLAALLWQTLRQRQVNVRHEPAPLVWVNMPAPPAPPPPPARSQAPAERIAVPRAAAPAARPIAVPEVPHESTLVQVPAPVAAAPAAQASSPASEPLPRLLDSEATRQAIRQTGRQALLHERAAAAMGTPIERTDTALAQGVTEAGQPDCMKDPNASVGHIGPLALGGILGLPFLAARVATGRCSK